MVAFDVDDAGVLSAPRIFAEIRPGLPDGLRLDTQGRLYISSESGVQIHHPDGSRLAEINVPEKVGNLTFGGRGNDWLYICASTSVYRIQLNTQGHTPL